jgi:hypothetical protein
MSKEHFVGPSMSVSLLHFSVTVEAQFILFIVIIPIVIPTVILFHIVISILLFAPVDLFPLRPLLPWAFLTLELCHQSLLPLALPPLTSPQGVGHPIASTISGLDHPGLRETRTASRSLHHPQA